MATGFGYVVKGVGGLYTVRLLTSASPLVPQPYTPGPWDGQTVTARGRGSLRQSGLLVGDLVEVTYDPSAGRDPLSADGGGVSVDRVLPRRSALIRPPVANLDYLFATLAAAAPDPDLETTDKLLCIAVHNGIAPVVVVNKCDLDPASADRLAAIYTAAGFPVFRTVGATGEGLAALAAYIASALPGKLAAFAGASGVGKSTVLGRLFPSADLATGSISARIARGKNTTRHVEILPLDPSDPATGYLADTPGFTMLDFDRFDFFGLDDLPATFPEFATYLCACRYSDCTHTGESATDCAVRAAVRSGAIPPSRHRTYCTLYDILKKKPFWK